MAQTDFTYNLTMKESQEKYSVEKTAGITLDAELCKNYSAKAITKAKQLKAKHGDRYDDQQYLDSGKTLIAQEISARYGAIHKDKVNSCDVKDIDWAIYTYEEIIEMETNGYEIPEDVLQWAHAQQEADVVNYVIVSDATANSDNTTDAIGTPKGELSQLQTKAKQNISKSEAAMEEATKSLEEYQLVANKAKEIKREKENTFKEKMDEISSMTEEWKKLDEKSKSGKLTVLEKQKYKELSKKLNGKDGTLMTEIQLDNSELDKFLKNLDGLNQEITENLTLAKDTIDSGLELSKYEKNYNSEQLPTATSGQIYDGNGKSSDTLYNVKGDEISDLAIEKGTELDEQSNTMSSDINTGDSADLNNFAKEYTSLATQTENNTKNVMGENFNQSVQESETEQKQAEKQSKEYSVEMKFTHKNAKKAAKTTALATAHLIPRERGVNKSDKELKKELKTIQKDAKALIKETSKTEEKIIKNKEEQEKISTKIEEIEKDIQTTETESTTQSKETVATNQTGEIEPTEENLENNEKTEKANEKQNLKDDLINTQDEGKDLKKDVSKAIKTSNKSTTKGEKLTKDLNKKNHELENRNENTKDVSEKTIIVGAGTVTKSFVTTALGTALETTGTALMSNPITFTKGAILVALGVQLQDQGKKELQYGLLAAGTGALGTVAGAFSDNTKDDASETEKFATQIFKANKQEIKESSKLIGEKAPSGEDSTAENKETTGEEKNTTTTNGDNVTSEIIKSQAATATTTDNNTTSESSTDNTADTTSNKTEAVEEPKTTENNTTENETSENKEDNNDNETANETAAKDEEKQKNNHRPTTDNSNSVNMEFNTPNAIRATETAVQATIDIFDEDSNVTDTQKEVNKNTKDNQKLVKNVNTETAKAVAKKEANTAEAESINNEITITQNEIENAQSEENATAAQDKITNLATQLDTTVAKDEQITSGADKSISNSVKQLNKSQKNTRGLSETLSAFEKTMINQQDVSQKTLAVGIGTGSFGVINSNLGAGMILSGLGLMSNPLTYSIGVAQQTAGKLLLTKGLLEIASGATATTAGTAGLVAHEIAEKNSKESESTLKAAQGQNKELEKASDEGIDKINKNENETNSNSNGDLTQKGKEKEKESELPILSDILTSQAASASTNANINDTTTTDDKADRKLSRFNTESIIESKKKKKRVQAVSASSGNKA